LIGGRPVETSEAFDDIDPSSGRLIAPGARMAAQRGAPSARSPGNLDITNTTLARA
jgi:hypothetical protein